MSTSDELERAVERATEEARLATECSWTWAILRPSDLRALLSERAELLAAVERMRGALIFYADHPPVFPPSDGPWGVGITDFGQRARAALTTGEANQKDKP